MMQIFVNGSDKAVEFYQKAFDAKILGEPVLSDEGDGTYYHAELDIYGQVLAIAEAKYTLQFSNVQSEEAFEILSRVEREPGNTMMFGLHFGEGKEDVVRKIYDVLKDGAKIISPLGECIYSPLEADLIDKFGIRWCIFV